MPTDQLSEVFDLVDVQGVLSGGFAVRGPWVTRAALDHPLKFIAMAHGRARLTADGVDGPIELERGDVAVLNNRSKIELEGGSGDGPPFEVAPGSCEISIFHDDNGEGDLDVLVGGRIDLNETGRALLFDALPPVGHVRAPDTGPAGASDILDRLFSEVTGDRIGSSFAIRQYGQLLLLEVLRAYIHQVELPPGWLRALSDERLRPAISLMHADPRKAWGLEELARAAAMSRTSFAERFRTVAGEPPLTYLTRWRMLLAQRALRDGDPSVRALASELGYGSESAFSTAFKRVVGESPLRYRHRMRAEAPGRPGPAEHPLASVRSHA